MSELGAKCERCRRSEYTKDGETIQLEVCWDAIRKMWLCFWCYLA